MLAEGVDDLDNGEIPAAILGELATILDPLADETVVLQAADFGIMQAKIEILAAQRHDSLSRRFVKRILG